MKKGQTRKTCEFDPFREVTGGFEPPYKVLQTFA